MASHLEFIAGVIEAAGYGQIGIDLFIDTLPPDVIKGVTLRDPMSGHQYDAAMGGFYNSEILVITRDNDSSAGRARANALAQALTINGIGDANTHISWMFPKTLPIVFPRDAADTLEISQRFSIGFAVIP